MPAKALKRARRAAGGRRKAAKRAARARRTNGAAGLMEHGRAAYNQAYGFAEQAGRAGSRAMRNMPDPRSLQSMVDERPLLLGAVGLGIGVLIGAMLPSFQHQSGGTTPPRRRRK